MARLIEVQDARVCPSTLELSPGDVLLFRATGGRVHSGDEVIELLGPFLQGVLGDDGRILAPAGLPNRVIFRARQPGRARIDVITGVPLHNPQTFTISLTVEF